MKSTGYALWMALWVRAPSATPKNASKNKDLRVLVSFQGHARDGSGQRSFPPYGMGLNPGRSGVGDAGSQGQAKRRGAASTAFRQNIDMKWRHRPPCVVANPRNSGAIAVVCA